MLDFVQIVKALFSNKTLLIFLGFFSGAVLAYFFITQFFGQEQHQLVNNGLTQEEERIIVHKGTEAPFSGKYNDFFEEGTYVCRRCQEPLYVSTSKFHSSCGWPSFDQEILGAVKHLPDADGMRTEIICNKCGAHLGHVFKGEKLTPKNVRHCVNSVSLIFTPKKKAQDLQSIVLGGGCFWCMEAVFQMLKGIKSVTSGYAGGTSKNPNYKDVCSGKTGYAEVIKVEYDSSIVKLDELLSVFFSMHDPTTLNRQGNDVGTQYRSIIFYTSIEEKQMIEMFIKKLELEKTFNTPIITQLEPFIAFYPAEKEHQNYYNANQNQGYCQVVISPKMEKLREKYKYLLK